MASIFGLLFKNFDARDTDAAGRWADDNTLVPLGIPVIRVIPRLCTGQARASTQGSHGWPFVSSLVDSSPAAIAHQAVNRKAGTTPLGAGPA